MNTTNTKRHLQTGIDSLEFMMGIPEEIWYKIDTVIFDPPYFDINTPSDVKRFHRRSKVKRFLDDHTVLGDWEQINKILKYAQSKINKGTIIYFDSRDNRYDLPYKIIWYKGRPSITGGVIMPYHEYIWLENINIKYSQQQFPSVMHHNIISSNQNKKIRTGYKPKSLFLELFDRLNSKFILDLFAGKGESILAADHLGLPIFACDSDKKLKWDKQPSLEDYI